MLQADLNRPLILAHAGGMGHARENSIKAVQQSIKYGADIIELDLRKSKDGIIFCYHGFGIFTFFLAFFLRYITFKNIRKFLKVAKLDEILRSIKVQKIIFLDIKDRNIKALEIDQICSKYEHNFWIADFSFKYLAKTKEALGHKYKYIFNFCFVNFEKGFKKSQEVGLDAFKIFPWQCKKSTVKRIKEAKLAYNIEPVFITNRGYKKLLNKFGSLWVSLNDLRKPNDMISLHKYL